MSVTAAVTALLAGPLTWMLLGALDRILPGDFLAAQMREQPAGTPAVRQIGGLALVPVYLASVAAIALAQSGTFALAVPAAAAIALLWLVGMADDHRHLPAGPRLAAHLVAALAVVWPLPDTMSVLGGLAPLWLERMLVVAGLVYAINVTNFMDGMDLMSVVGVGIPLAACALLLAHVPGQELVAFTSLALAAALAGFAIFNRPPARLYLGDNGALPLGLAAGMAGLHLCFATNPVTAILP
ncbi:MAG: glycoside hydrolase, partial [Pseudomonadota bacterium]|nr:glycoside hydrolase [Pseudomonadota bacterium]